MEWVGRGYTHPLVVMCVCVCLVQEHKWMNICAVNSLWIWLCRVGACIMCGLFSMLMLLAQNLLTQRLRATATFKPLLCHNDNHKIHPQFCVFFLKYTRSKWKHFRLFSNPPFFFCWVQHPACVPVYPLLYLVSMLQHSYLCWLLSLTLCLRYLDSRGGSKSHVQVTSKSQVLTFKSQASYCGQVGSAISQESHKSSHLKFWWSTRFHI